MHWHASHAEPQLPQTPEFAAALLIIREALHHWGLHSLQAIRGHSLEA